MIHYTCDRCKRQIDTSEQTRYVVQIEIQSAIEEPTMVFNDDVDQLSELHELLEGLHSESLDDESLDELMQGEPLGDDHSQLSHQGRYDLCPDCHHQFLKNPLGRDAVMAIGFSNN